MLLHESDRPWIARAGCRGMGAAMYPYGDPFEDHTGEAKDWSQARAICADCPVVGECLAHTLATEPHAKMDKHGFAGGLTPSQRYTLQERQRAAQREGSLA